MNNCTVGSNAQDCARITAQFETGLVPSVVKKGSQKHRQNDSLSRSFWGIL